MKTKWKAIFTTLILCLATNAYAQDNSDNTAPSPEQNRPLAEAKSDDSKDQAVQVIQAMQAYYDNAKSYSAEFIQEFESIDGITNQSSGTVWFKKPGLMRWDYEKPEPRFLLVDGKYFWSWEPLYRQYCKQEVQDVQLPTALSFLAGEGKILDDFNAKIAHIKMERITIELVPKVQTLAYEKIHFDIIMPTAKVYRATLFDSMGNTNIITFKSPEINAELDTKLFQFTPPKDANLICR